MADDIIELDLGVTPEPGFSGAVCLQTGAGAFLTFNAVRPTARPSPFGGFVAEAAGTAVVELRRCLVSRFGYPNDEARFGIPQYRDLSYGIYEVRESSWILDIVRLNRFQFPATSDDWIRRNRHFLFTFHDETFECIANGLELEVVNEPYAATFERIRRRAFGDGAG